MATGHTVTAFDEDLGQLRAMISEMGGRAEAAIIGSLEALANRDLESAAKIVEADKKIDELEAEVERQVVRLIALRAPLADDLREVLAALKIAGLVERMGDYAKNIAKRIPQLQEARGMDAMAVLPAMGKIAAEMVRNVLDAFVLRDSEAALAVAARDKAVDDFYNSLFRALLTYMMENPHNITASTHLLFIAKNIERIGDHATNVAEMVYFAATGRQMAERAKGGDPLLGANA
jgi:phosphate transport system protein